MPKRPLLQEGLHAGTHVSAGMPEDHRRGGGPSREARMTGQELREALHAGRRVYGTTITSPSLWALTMYRGLDFAFIDNEHIPLGRETTMALCQALRARGVAPLVRIPTADPTRAAMTLDLGADGIICPYVEDPEVARQMVGVAKWRPLKGRKLAEFLRTGGGVAPHTLEYLRHWNRNSVLIFNIESRPAFDRLDELLAVEGLDGILIGPHDLSISLDMPEQYDRPEFVRVTEQIIARARAAGLGAGLHYWMGLEGQMHYVRRGANMILYSSDVTEATRSINAAIAQLRAAFDAGAQGANAGEACVSPPPA